MRIKTLVIGIVIIVVLVMILTAGCSSPYKQVCYTQSGNVTSKAMIPDQSIFGSTQYTITLDYNATYRVTSESFAKAKVGDHESAEMCYTSAR